MKLLKYDLIPRRFDLRWSGEKKAVVVRIHKDCLSSAPVISRDSPYVRVISRKFGLDGLFDSFSGDLSSDFFGFNQAVERGGSVGDYIDFFVPMPEVWIENSFICEECAGTGQNLQPYSMVGDKCFRCNGSGKSHVNDWRAAYTTTASLGLLFDLLDIGEEDTSAKDYQHIALSMVAEYGQHGSSLGGCLGIELSQYLRSDPDVIVRKIIQNAISVMRSVYWSIWKMGKRDNRSSFRGNVQDGFLTMDCPGDACGIHTSDHLSGGSGDKMSGREFSCHNVDTPLQSLTLLAGIASIVGEVSDIISKRKYTTLVE